MESIAICVGVNNFKFHPDSSLSGCENDATDMFAFFKSIGVDDAKILRGKQATKSEIIGALTKAIIGDYDKIYFSYSSHGTKLPDDNGDESDKADEAFVCYDTSADLTKNIIRDDELYTLFASALRGTAIEVFLDTCHSGTGLRLLNEAKGKPRFLENKSVSNSTKVNGGKKAEIHKVLPNVILWSGCKDDEYSMDAEIDGRYNGAFTRSFLDAFAKKPRARRISIWRTMCRTIKEFDQHPQLEAYWKHQLERFME